MVINRRDRQWVDRNNSLSKEFLSIVSIVINRHDRQSFDWHNINFQSEEQLPIISIVIDRQPTNKAAFMTLFPKLGVVYRKQYSMAFQTPIANTDIYKCNFFPDTIRD